MKSLPALVALAFVLWSGSVPASAEEILLVTDYGPDAKAVTIERKGKDKPVQIGLPLESGDRILVAKDAFVEIDSGVTPQRLENGDTPFVVEKLQGSALARTAARLSDALDWWDTRNAKRPMLTRDGEEPKIMVFEGVKNPLFFAGSRILKFRVASGKGVTVRMVDEHGKMAGSASATGAGEIALEANVVAGRTYRLNIMRKGETEPAHTYRLKATKPIDGLLAPANAKPLTAILTAMASAGETNGQTAFEALQLIHATDGPPRLKDAAINALQSGDWP